MIDAAASAQPIERRFSLTSLARLAGPENRSVAAGKYLLYSNDGTQAYVIARYEEDGSASAEQTDGSTRAIEGTFWRTLRIKPDVAAARGWIAYAGTPGRSAITGLLDADGIIAAAAAVNGGVEEVAELFKTREAAVQEALRRYVTRTHRLGQHEVWGVFDRVMLSWPSLVADRRIHDATSNREEAETDAEWLNRHRA
jgi:hypothetical protein